MHLQNSLTQQQRGLSPFFTPSSGSRGCFEYISNSVTHPCIKELSQGESWAQAVGLLDTLHGLCYVIVNPQYATYFVFSLREQMSSEARIKMLMLFKMLELPQTLKYRHYHFTFSIQVSKVPLPLPWHWTGQEFGRFGYKAENSMASKEKAYLGQADELRTKVKQSWQGEVIIHYIKITKLGKFQVKHILRTAPLNSTWCHHSVRWLLHRSLQELPPTFNLCFTVQRVSIAQQNPWNSCVILYRVVD